MSSPTDRPQVADPQHPLGETPAPPMILIVDDEAMLRQLFEQVLRQQRYATYTAASVMEAEALRQQRGLAHLGLVIAEIQLCANPQRREGYALYERWTAAQPTLPFLLLSGNPASRSLPAIQAGAVRLLAKPFPFRALVDAVQALVGRP